MNTRAIKSLTLVTTLLLSWYADAQLNPLTNSFTKNENVKSPTHVLKGPVTTAAGWPCPDNAFYATDDNGMIVEFALNGNTVSITNTLQIAGETSLAFCNNINGGSYSPTFYSQKNSGSFFDGSNWQSVGFGPSNINYGGGGNHIYLHNTAASSVLHYNGSQYNTIYSQMFLSLGVADLAVDPQGNVIFVIGNMGTMTSDTLYVFSPSGQKIEQIPFSIPFEHCYGSFYMNGVYYIGIGVSNPLYPNTLLPVTISPGAAVIGNPIPMPAGDFYDLASCGSSLPTGIITRAEDAVNVFPNPATTNLTIQFPDKSHRTIRLMDVSGRTCLISSILEERSDIPLSDLSPGVYIMEATTAGSQQTIRKKIIIE